MPDQQATTAILIRKLESISSLDDGDRAAIKSLPMQFAELRADQDIVREGDRPSRSCLLIEGFACWFKVTGEGKRQILAFQIPGDIPDMHCLHLERLDSTLSTLTPCKVAFVQHEALRDLCEKCPRTASAFWRSTLIDAAVCRAWVVNIGSRQAYGRIAHALCEIIVRLRAVGLANGALHELPITQSELGDAVGLSTVHVNRTLKELRAHRLINLNGTTLEVLDWPGLQKAGDFDPAYLHLKRTG